MSPASQTAGERLQDELPQDQNVMQTAPRLSSRRAYTWPLNAKCSLEVALSQRDATVQARPPSEHLDIHTWLDSISIVAHNARTSADQPTAESSVVLESLSVSQNGPQGRPIVPSASATMAGAGSQFPKCSSFLGFNCAAADKPRRTNSPHSGGLSEFLNELSAPDEGEEKNAKETTSAGK